MTALVQPLTLSPACLEVVLVLLLAKYTFRPSDKDIYWNLAGVSYPSVRGSSKPQLPIKVGFVKWE